MQPKLVMAADLVKLETNSHSIANSSNFKTLKIYLLLTFIET